MNIIYEGIDVSKHQGQIQWDKLAKDPSVKFVIIRAGYGKYYPSQIDQKFEYNYQKAKEYNIPVGAYWYSYATSTAEVKEEMAAFLKTIEGKQFEFPIYFDQEYEPGIIKLTNQQRTDIIKTALGILEGKGYYAGLYCSLDWINNKVVSEQLKSYDTWIASYSAKTPISKLRYGMWQYSSSGQASGVSGKVDRNHCYKDYPSIIKKAKLNGFKTSTSTSSSAPNVAPTQTPIQAATSKDYVLDWPLKGAKILTAGYYYSGGALHSAIDLRVNYKQPVYAAGSGKVNFTYTWNGRVTNGDTNSYGNCVKILHDARYNGKTVETLYAHLDSYCVRNGQTVFAGQLIGYAGYTGHVVPAGFNGKHLHFEVRLNRKKMNPLVWLDNDFTVKNSSVYTFGKGERSAIRGSITVAPVQKKTLTVKPGSWVIRTGPSTSYKVVGQYRGPMTLEYVSINGGWYKLTNGYYIGPAAVSSHT